MLKRNERTKKERKREKKDAHGLMGNCDENRKKNSRRHRFEVFYNWEHQIYIHLRWFKEQNHEPEHSIEWHTSDTYCSNWLDWFKCMLDYSRLFSFVHLSFALMCANLFLSKLLKTFEKYHIKHTHTV